MKSQSEVVEESNLLVLRQYRTEKSARYRQVWYNKAMDKETIIYAELDMNLPAACKMEHDTIGHYARPDVLELKVNEK